MAQPGRRNAPQLVHEISALLGPAQANAGSGVLGAVGGAGAYLLIAHFVTSVAFDSTTITLGIGTTPGGVEVLAAASVKAIGRTDVVFPAASAGVYVNPQQLFWTFAQTGGPATVGQVMAWVEFVPALG